MRELSPASGSWGCWGGLPGPDENRNDEDTDGSDDTDPDGLDGDGSELCGEAGCEYRGESSIPASVNGTDKRRGRCRMVSALRLGCGSSPDMPPYVMGFVLDISVLRMWW